MHLPLPKESHNFRGVPQLSLKDIPELHDKIIVSTAKYLGLPIITKDKGIQNLAYIKTIW